MKRMLEVLGWLAAVALFAFAGQAVLARAAAREANGGEVLAQLTARPVAHAPGGGAQDSQTTGERQTRGRRARDDGEDLGPAGIMRGARTIYVHPTRHLDRKYLEYKLHKYRELRDWDLALVEDADAADLVISIDKTALNYIFTITDPRTSRIVASGKCVAVNGLVAAEYLGREIIKKIKDVRASSERGPRRKRSSPGEDDEEWSES